ncbi:hypothetical protein BH10BAC1_BH10BAC1_03690 [soil metagenome]
MKKIFTLSICLSAASFVSAQSTSNAVKVNTQQVAPAPETIAPTPANAEKNTSTMVLTPLPSQIVTVTALELKKQNAIAVLPAKKQD